MAQGCSGVLRGSSLLVNPNLLGLKYGALNIDVSPRLNKPDVISRLKGVEGVLYIHDFVGSFLWAGFAYEDDSALADKLKLMEEEAGSEGAFSRIPYPPSTAALTRPEAELVLRLLRGRFESYGELAKELGISVRTLQRRLSRLTGEGTLFSLPSIDYRAITGSVPADLLVFFRDAEAARGSAERILAIVGDRLVFAALWDVVGMCSMILPSLAPMNDISEQVRQVDGVKATRVEIVRERIDQASVLGAYVEKWMKSKGFEASRSATTQPSLA
jgi:DNA-binding Lrp family transcriptional regulator